MTTRLTRQQLHALVWEQPITRLAKQFGLSDVALHKICRKFDVPTPPTGHWAKKAHGKPVATTPLPQTGDTSLVIIRESTASNEPLAVAEARSAATTAIAAAPLSETSPANPILERTVTKLAAAKPKADGLIRCQAKGLAHVAVRPESAERAATVLRQLVKTGQSVEIQLVTDAAGACWQCDEEAITFELIEVADHVEHVPTQKELDAVAKWQREREETHRRHGYWRDWGEPKLPKWEQRFQGRLAVKLEEVRIQSERSPWGEPIMRTFSDTRTRDVSKAIPRILATVAAMAAAKKANREYEARAHAAAVEAARSRAEAERRRREDQQAGSLLEQLLSEHGGAERLRGLLGDLRATEPVSESRLARFVEWAEARLQRLEAGKGPVALEQRLAKAGLFSGEEE